MRIVRAAWIDGISIQEHELQSTRNERVEEEGNVLLAVEEEIIATHRGFWEPRVAGPCFDTSRSNAGLAAVMAEGATIMQRSRKENQKSMLFGLVL